MHLYKKLGVFTLALGLALLSACGSSGQTATPTQDANKILTEVAVTVQSRLTQMAALTPSVTPTPLPTATQPTATPSVTPTAAGSVTATGTPPKSDRSHVVL